MRVPGTLDGGRSGNPGPNWPKRRWRATLINLFLMNLLLIQHRNPKRNPLITKTYRYLLAWVAAFAFVGGVPALGSIHAPRFDCSARARLHADEGGASTGRARKSFEVRHLFIPATADGQAVGASSEVKVQNEVRPVASPKLGASTLFLEATGGSSSIVVSDSGPWTAAANNPFLHISPGGASGTGSGLVVFTYDAFTRPGTRTGTLTIAGVTLTVIQVGTNYIAPTGVSTLLSGGLNGPNGLAVDAAGNVYIADTLDNAIKEWSPATQQLTTLLSSGLNNPLGVAVDAAGNVYIADSLNNAIKRWSASSQQLTTLVSDGLNNPGGVAVDGAGNVYIADSLNNAIKEWNASTQWVTTLVSTGLNHPRGVAVDAAGNVYIADYLNNTIKQWKASTGQVTTLVSSGLDNPSGVAVDGSGNVYIADSFNDGIKEWNAATQKVTPLAPSGLNIPWAVAADGQGNVYIADGSNTIGEMPNVFVGPANLTELPAEGSDSLLQVLPATTSFVGVFAPASDQSWLTIGTIANGAVSFSFTTNTSSTARVAHIDVLGQPITVTQNGLATQSITFPALASQSLGATPFLVSAIATSGLPVSAASTTPSVCTVSGMTVSLLSAGMCAIQASQPGDTSYSAAPPVTQRFPVTGESQSFGAARMMTQANEGAQSILSCNTPTGTTFTESFGDTGGGACGFNGNTGCNWPWHQNGTGATIVPSPGTPGANTACANSLQMVTGTANNYISMVGPTPTVPSGTTTDTTIYVYPVATSLGAYNAQTLYVQSLGSDGGNFPCRIDWHTTSLGAVAVRGEGTNVSSDTSVLSLNAWHTIALHCASGAGSSYVALDGGTQETFTAQASDWNYQTIGALNGTTQSISYAIGSITVNSSIAGGNPPLTYVNFSGQPSGATLTTAILNSSTTCGNGTWGSREWFTRNRRDDIFRREPAVDRFAHCLWIRLR